MVSRDDELNEQTTRQQTPWYLSESPEQKF